MRTWSLSFFCLIVSILTGWGHSGPRVKVGLLLDQAQSRKPFIKSFEKELEGDRADLLSSDAKGNPALQENQFGEMIQKGVQVLVLFPCDARKAASIVAAAHQAGIKVIALEQPVPDSGLDYLIAFDPVKEGELQARSVVKKVPRGRYVLLGGDPKERISQGIREGQMKVLQPLIDKGEVQIAGSRWVAGARKSSQAAKVIEGLLTTSRNGVDAVLASDMDLAEGASIALKKTRSSGSTVLSGIGTDLATCRRIASGSQLSTVYQLPRKLAEETAYLAGKLARKARQFDCQFVEMPNGRKTVQAVLLTPVEVDAQNLEKTILKDQVQ